MKKEQVMNICKVWNVSSDDVNVNLSSLIFNIVLKETFYYISAETLSNWLLTTEKEGCEPTCSGEVAELKSVKVLDNKELVCSHGKMNPTKVYLAKKISMVFLYIRLVSYLLYFLRMLFYYYSNMDTRLNLP